MKKTIKTSVIALMFALCAFGAKAATEGSYVGINLTRMSAELEDGGRFLYNGSYIRDLSLNYKYALNMNGFIVAPELEYTFGLSDVMQEGYAIKLNVGYDLTDNFAFLANIGGNSNKSLDRKESMTYGFGIKYQLSDAFNLEASLDMRENGANYETTKVGISYNF